MPGRSRTGSRVQPLWSRRDWVTLLTAGETPVVKYGSAGPAVRRLQRALRVVGAASYAQDVRPTGLFDANTVRALRVWQKRVGVEVSGVAGTQTWAAIRAGRY